MAEVPARATHYSIMPFGTSGLIRTDFGITLLKNGEVNDLPVDSQEVDTGVYKFFFNNDGEHNSVWTLIVTYGGVGWIEDWFVKKQLVEQVVQEIRAKQGEGGFFQGAATDKISP